MFADAARNVGIAWRLARFDATAARDFEDDDRAFWRSFRALPIVMALDWLVSSLTVSAFQEDGGGIGRAPLATGWLVVGWLLALNIAAEFARHMKRQDFWPRYVIAHNWAALVQGGVLTVGIAALGIFGAPSDAYGFWVVVVGFWSLVYDWFIVKSALEVEGPPAALLMVILLFTALFVNQIAASFAG
jgi:hypothetical protein